MNRKCFGCSFSDYCDNDFFVCDLDESEIADMIEELEDWRD